MYSKYKQRTLWGFRKRKNFDSAAFSTDSGENRRQEKEEDYGKVRSWFGIRGGHSGVLSFVYLGDRGFAREYCTCDAMVSILIKINFTYLKIIFILAYNYHCITSAD